MCSVNNTSFRAPTAIILLLLCSLGFFAKILKVFLYWCLLNLAIESKSAKHLTITSIMEYSTLFLFSFVCSIDAELILVIIFVYPLA